MVGCFLLASSLLTLSGCDFLSKAEAESPSQAGKPGAPQEVAAVNVVVARAGSVRAAREYTGTTQPVRLVSLRSQVEGQLLSLTVEVGDTVSQGQVLGQVDAAVLTTNVAEAQAEVAARRSEVAQAQIGVSDAQAQVNRAKAELQQAQSDLNRLQYLSNQGAISEQQAEQARTRVRTAQETLRSAQEQVRTRQEAVTAAQGRVTAQRAVVAREQERQSYTALTAPVTGAVLEKLTESGTVIQPGTEVLKLGDFSRVKVVVQISELELGNIRPGQTVPVRLDAFPQREFKGQVLRVSPAADPVARLVPVEIAIPNPEGTIGSGLLARVSLTPSSSRPRVLVPETALQTNEDRKPGSSANKAQPGNPQEKARGGEQPGPARPPSGTGTVFVLEGAGNEGKVSARQVTLGQRGDGQVEVLSGLQAGERIIARSSKALKAGDPVRLSVLSERS